MSTIREVRLTWRGNELFGGSWFLGDVWEYRGKWRASPPGLASFGESYATEAEARGALLAAVEKALKENEDG